MSNKETFWPGEEATPYAEHCINVPKDQIPIAVPSYRMAAEKKEILRQEFDKMLEVIEECESPWAAPLVLVPKPNGKTRVCIDYR